MVQDPNYGYSVKQIKHLLNNSMGTIQNVKDANTQTAILANLDLIKMIVGILEREIPDEQESN